MPKFLIEATYTTEGLRGLIKDTGSGRKAAVQKSLKAMGGKLESMHFCFGKHDVILIADMPDNITAAALTLAVGASGLVRSDVRVLLTAEEVDKAIKHKAKYRAPGAK